MGNYGRTSGGYGPAGPAQPQQPAIKIKDVVEKDDPDLLIKEAQELARRLGRQDDATKTQIRRLFTTMRQIQMKWQQDVNQAYRELILMQPRLVYQTSKKAGLKVLSDTLQVGIQSVGKDRQKLERLVQFYEATLAYWIGRDTGGQ
jgi:CRISPR type III-A-associated protein Csm2